MNESALWMKIGSTGLTIEEFYRKYVFSGALFKKMKRNLEFSSNEIEWIGLLWRCN